MYIYIYISHKYLYIYISYMYIYIYIYIISVSVYLKKKVDPDELSTTNTKLLNNYFWQMVISIYIYIYHIRIYIYIYHICIYIHNYTYHINIHDYAFVFAIFWGSLPWLPTLWRCRHPHGSCGSWRVGDRTISQLMGIHEECNCSIPTSYINSTHITTYNSVICNTVASQLIICTLWVWLTFCHGKIHHAIKFGKPSISMGHLYHGYVSHNQRVNLCNILNISEYNEMPICWICLSQLWYLMGMVSSKQFTQVIYKVVPRR